jgi:hypothetical protein
MHFLDTDGVEEMSREPAQAKDPGRASLDDSSMWDSEIDGLRAIDRGIRDSERANRREDQGFQTGLRNSARRMHDAVFRMNAHLVQQGVEVHQVLKKLFQGGGPRGPRGPQRPMPA